jgi:hypothetical protein
VPVAGAVGCGRASGRTLDLGRPERYVTAARQGWLTEGESVARRRWVGVAVVCLSMAVPAIALGAARGASSRRPRLPACAGFSTTTIENLISANVTLKREKSPGGDICPFSGHKDGHYRMAVNIGLVPGTENLFGRLEETAEKVARAQGATFKIVKSGNPAIFEYAQIQTGDGEERCAPAKKLPVTGPPSCDGEPAWWHQDAYEYGTIKGSTTKTIVSTEIYAELGDTALNGAVELDADILSGKLR